MNVTAYALPGFKRDSFIVVGKALEGLPDHLRPERRRPAFAASVLIWQSLHGTVGLRISRAIFPWPPFAETVTKGVDLILDGAATR